MTHALQRLQQLGLQLPALSAPAGAYVPTRQVGELLFLSGQLPRGADGAVQHPGRVGEGVTAEQAAEAARTCGLHLLAQVEAAVGLERVAAVVKLTGFVASAPGFFAQPQVMNGASQLMLDVFGEAGKHSRSAVGVAALPSNAPVEVEAIFQLHPVKA